MDNTGIQLTPTIERELALFFEFQLDKKASYLAAFTPKDQTDQQAYMEKYSKHLADPTINMKTIWFNDVVVGSLAKFMIGNDAEITYWIDRKFWGKGIATTALMAFLRMESTRPLFGRVAFDHYASQKVLENCGFVKFDSDSGFANARQEIVEEFIYKLY